MNDTMPSSAPYVTGPFELCLPHLQPGSFEFTPEGYAKCSFWMPGDAFSWDDFRGLGPLSPDEFEFKLADFKAKAAGKMEVIKATYHETSLRRLLPDRWSLAYDRHRAWKKKQGDSYYQSKHTLYLKSIILGYGCGPIQRVTSSGAFAKYIKEHCASSARLKAIALRSYESVANTNGFHTWNSMAPPIFLALTAAASSLDSMATVLWALLFNESPSGRDIPDMAGLFRRLCPDIKKPSQKRHLFGDAFFELFRSKWFVNLRAARDEVIHRGGAPAVHDKFGVAFDFDLGIFTDTPLGVHQAKPRLELGKKMRRIHLDRIMRDFVKGVEKWEKKHAAKLASLACYQSYMSEGIILGVEFWDSNLLWDGSGPNHVVRSDSPEFIKIQTDRIRRARHKRKNRGLKSAATV